METRKGDSMKTEIEIREALEVLEDAGSTVDQSQGHPAAMVALAAVVDFAKWALGEPNTHIEPALSLLLPLYRLKKIFEKIKGEGNGQNQDSSESAERPRQV
jgi:hypothetical protein